VQSGFRSIVYGAECIWDYGSYGANLHDGAAGANQERRENGADVHHSEHICREGGLDFRESGVEGGNSVVWVAVSMKRFYFLF